MLQLGAVPRCCWQLALCKILFLSQYITETPLFTTALPAHFVLCYLPFHLFHLLGIIALKSYESLICSQSFI